jgi:hypothetical protein
MDMVGVCKGKQYSVHREIQKHRDKGRPACLEKVKELCGWGCQEVSLRCRQGARQEGLGCGSGGLDSFRPGIDRS